MKQKPLLQLGNFLPYRLSVLSNRISLDIATEYEVQFGLSQREWRIMATLGEQLGGEQLGGEQLGGEQPGLAARDVVRFTAMDKVAVSRAVNSLMDKKLVERTFSNEDKRRSELSLSPKGQDIYREIVPRALAYEKAILDKLNADEVKALDSMIKKLMDIQEHVKD
jgi:DNA-binding MarR family transcriptional regulator